MITNIGVGYTNIFHANQTQNLLVKTQAMHVNAFPTCMCIEWICYIFLLFLIVGKLIKSILLDYTVGLMKDICVPNLHVCIHVIFDEFYY